MTRGSCLLLAVLATACPAPEGELAARPEGERRAVGASAPAAAPTPDAGRPALVAPRFTVDLESAGPGQLAELRVSLGDRVAQGEAVAVLDDSDLRYALRLAEARHDSAGARLSASRHDLDYASRRADQASALREYLSEDERDQLHHDLNKARAAKTSARRERGVERVEIERLRAQVEALTLRAPFAAEVAGLYRDPGQRVLAHEPLLRLTSTERVIRFAVDAPDAARFPLGAAIELYSAAIAPTRAHVVSVAPEIDAAGMVLVEATFDDPAHGAALRPGLRGEVRPATTPTSSNRTAKPQQPITKGRRP